MGKLIYSAMASLDGYVTDEGGRFDWAEPDEEVHTFANLLEKGVGTSLYGRRMYETMVAWESPEMTAEGQPAYIVEYAQIWRAAEKVVYSSTLEAPLSERTRIERVFNPEDVLRLKQGSERDISIGGPTLAAQALEAGLVDGIYLFIAPVIVGGGLPLFPRHLRLDLQLVDERRFASGFVYLQYEIG